VATMAAIWWPYGGHGGHMAAIWRPWRPYGGHMVAMAAIWWPWRPYGGHMATIMATIMLMEAIWPAFVGLEMPGRARSRGGAPKSPTQKVRDFL